MNKSIEVPSFKHLLESKFLITGADTLEPRPFPPHNSKEEAIQKARGYLTGFGSQELHRQTGCIIWAPVAVVELSKPPITVREV